eukprot:GFUD01001710.1.p1 GENE.GFUD01001710.1~~GFUD01001710.1.p1  ORF type:complete len:505 (-),score=129.89 GFUD01001710.1:141-1655(-)
MCRVFQAACRVCLTENIGPPYIYLLEDESVSEAIGNVLNLQTRLFDASLYPNHVCENCQDVIMPFIKLQEIALAHEKFLLRYQEKIKQFGVQNVRISMPPECDAAQSNLDEEGTNLANFDNLEDTLDFEFGSGKDLDSRSQFCTDKIMLKEQEFHDEEVEENINDQNDNSSNIKDEEVHCHICGPSRVLKKSSLPNHLKTFHKERDIDCEIPNCEIKFKKKSDMKKHVKNIHKGERSLCIQCGDSFKDLHYHIKVFHENVSFPCDMCNKKYTTKQGLNFHIKHTHGDSKKEVCHYCAVEVKHVRHHIKMMHSGVVEKKVSCQDESCSKKFRTKQEATIHYNAAHLNKKEMCPLCGGWYKNLYTHIHQTHQSEKKHVCDQCGKAFGKKNDLKVHKDRIHLLKRYICPECGKTISKIREHLKTVHNVANVNMAEIENVKFDSSAQQSINKSFEHQMKPYDLCPTSSQVLGKIAGLVCSEAGTVSLPLDTKDGVTLAMMSHQQGWSL